VIPEITVCTIVALLYVFDLLFDCYFDRKFWAQPDKCCNPVAQTAMPAYARAKQNRTLSLRGFASFLSRSSIVIGCGGCERHRRCCDT